MKRLRLFLLVAGFYILMVPLAQAQIIQREILGKWAEIGGTETIEFFKDGTVSIVTQDSAASGKYKFEGVTRMRMGLEGMKASAGPAIIKVTFMRNDLLLTGPMGKVTKYSRVGLAASDRTSQTYVAEGRKYLRD
jgi:hypothetical protein